MADLNHRKVILDLLKDVEEQKGSANLLGSVVNNPEALAKAAEILRNPRYETFQYVFTRDSKVVGVTALSFRLVNVSATVIGEPEPYADEIVYRAKQVKADKYFFLHNHPSGDPTPSREDLSTTINLVKDITKKSDLKFQGHVIINSKHYSNINELGHYSLHPIIYEKSYDLDQNRNKDTLFNQIIQEPKQFAALAKSVQKSSDCFQMVGLSTKNKLNCLFDMSYDIFKVSEKRLLASVKKWAFASGINKFGLANFDDRKLPFEDRLRILAQMEKSGLIVDIISPEGTSYREIAKFSPRMDIRYKRKKAQVVHEYFQSYESKKPDEQYFDDLFDWAKHKMHMSVHETADPIIIDSELLEAYKRAVEALERVKGVAMQKAFEATQVNAEAVSDEIIRDINQLSISMHGSCHDNKTWDHVSKAFVNEDYLPSLPDQYTDTPEPGYVKNLVKKYTFKINGAQAKISQSNSYKHKR